MKLSQLCTTTKTQGFCRPVLGRAGLLLVVVAALAPSLVAQHVQAVSKEEATALIKSGAKVKVVLKAGTYVEGKVKDITLEAVDMDVRKSDNTHDVAKGPQRIGLDRIASVTIVRYKGNKRKWLPIILSSTLGACSVYLGGMASEDGNAAYIPAAVGFTGGLAVAGYYGGKALDRNEMTLTFK